MKLLRAWLPSSEIILERNEYFFIILPSQPNHTLIILTKRKYTSKLKNTSYFGVLSLILLLFFFFLFPSVLIFVPFIILKSLQKKNTNLKIRYSNRNQPDVLCRPVHTSSIYSFHLIFYTAVPWLLLSVHPCNNKDNSNP